VAVVRACPVGSRLSFDHSEPESFVAHFRPWSHRDRATDYEADYYTIDERFVLLAERLTAETALELDHHWHIVGPDGVPLIQSMDDFTIIAVTREFHARLTFPFPKFDII